MHQPLAIRLTHWLNVVFLALMIGSGLQIFNAHTALYAADASDPGRVVFSLPIPVQQAGRVRNRMVLLGHDVDTGPVRMPRFGPQVAVGGWLAGARRWHLAIMWLFVANGLVYLAFLLFGGEAKRRLFRRRDFGGVLPMVRYYLHLGPHPETDGYNALQRLTYTLLLLVGAPLLIFTGLAMSPAFDAHFPWVVTVLGGRQSARAWHFLLMTLFVAFTVLHVILVGVAGWPTLRGMIRGGEPEEAGLG